MHQMDCSLEHRVLHAVETLNVDHLDGVNVWEINSFSVLDNKDRSLFLEDVLIDQIFSVMLEML